MNTIQILPVTTAHVVELQQISQLTFQETFSEQNTEDNMIQYLKNSFSIEKLTAELQETSSEFYFAYSHTSLVGYLKLNIGASPTATPDAKALEIERIYLLQAFQGQGIGQLLLNKAIARAQEKHMDYVWLGVWEHNTKAIQFYKKTGFVVFDSHVFQLGEELQTDVLMRLNTYN